MKINAINTNTFTHNTFKGYEDVVSNHVGDKNNFYHFTCLSMKLNNEGEPDLDKWRSLQKDYMHIKNPSDILTISQFYPLKENCIVSSNLAFPIHKYITPSPQRAANLQFYTLAASLTKRVANDEKNYIPQNLMEVLKETAKNVKWAFSDENISKIISTCKVGKCQEHAFILNSNISAIMRKYFAS
jgi:hypothetical protein